MKVYLSSTLDDLRPERDAVRQVLAKDVVVRDSYEAHESDLRASCIGDVHDSDLYIGLVGLRYGFRPDGGETSITEMEFQAAGEARIPRLVFIKREEAIPVTLTDADAPGGLDRVRRWRARVQSEAAGGIRPAIFDSIADLREAVLRAVQGLSQRRERRAQASAGHARKIFESVRLLQEGPLEIDQLFDTVLLARRVVITRPNAELQAHEELVNVSGVPRHELIRMIVSDTPVEFDDLQPTATLTIGGVSFDAAVSATQPRDDGRLFSVRLGFRGRTVAPGETLIADWCSRHPGSVGRNEDYWVFNCSHRRPIRQAVSEAVFPSEVADYGFFRVRGDGALVPIAMDPPVSETRADGTTWFVYRAALENTADTYLMTWRLR